MDHNDRAGDNAVRSSRTRSGARPAQPAAGERSEAGGCVAGERSEAGGAGCAEAGDLSPGSVPNSGLSIFSVWHDRASVVRLIVCAVFGFAINQLAYFLAIHYSNAGVATAIEQSAPVIVLLVVILRERRRPRSVELAVLAMVIGGAFLLATGGDWGTLKISTRALVWALIACVTCAMYTMMPGQLIVRYGNFETSGWCLLLGGVLMMPYAKLWILPSGDGLWCLGTLLGLAFVTLVGSVAAFGFYLYGTTMVGPERASVYGLFEAVVATFASLIFLNQKFTLTDYLGIAAIICGIVLLTLWSSRKGKD